MSKQHVAAQFKRLEDDIVELRYFDQSKSSGYLSWEMPISEATDLARWWEKEGMHLRKRQLPVIGHKFGNILISILTHARVDMRGFDLYGGLKTLGYSLPIKVVECLSIGYRTNSNSRNQTIERTPSNVRQGAHSQSWRDSLESDPSL